MWYYPVTSKFHCTLVVFRTTLRPLYIFQNTPLATLSRAHFFLLIRRSNFAACLIMCTSILQPSGHCLIYLTGQNSLAERFSDQRWVFFYALLLSYLPVDAHWVEIGVLYWNTEFFSQSCSGWHNCASRVQLWPGRHVSQCLQKLQALWLMLSHATPEIMRVVVY